MRRPRSLHLQLYDLFDAAAQALMFLLGVPGLLGVHMAEILPPHLSLRGAACQVSGASGRDGADGDETAAKGRLIARATISVALLGGEKGGNIGGGQGGGGEVGVTKAVEEGG